MHTTTTDLVSIATGKISNLADIQSILDDRSSRIMTKADANDLGFITGLNGKLTNDVNPWNSGDRALAFDLGFAEAQCDLNDFPDLSDEGEGGEDDAGAEPELPFATRSFDGGSVFALPTLSMAALIAVIYALPL